MCGTIGTARQASAGGYARHAAAADRAAPKDGTARQPARAVPVPPLADPQGNDVTGRWPLRSFLELGALPSAVPCARLHTRHLLWEWGLTSLTDSAELIVSEIMTPGGPGESHPRAPTERSVTISRHSARLIWSG